MTEISKTIYLPKTNFSMRANLNKTEPKWMDFWNENKIFKKLKKSVRKNKKFVLHDGPPYANGHIHLGHALNKILKDIICRAYFQMGFDVDYIPGWDCHGLPIEWKIEENYRKEGLDKNEINQLNFRDDCRKFAESWIDIQCDEFKRLGIDCNWESKYTTMTHKSEGTIVSELLKFLEDGRLYLGYKPVMWSVVEKTALAEAEVEYQEKLSNSIFVKFPIKNATSSVLEKSSIIIWTTTPWTLPCNRAIAFSKEFDYLVIKFNKDVQNFNIKNNEKIIFEKNLAESFLKKNNLNDFEILHVIRDSQLEGNVCSHPLKDLGYTNEVPLVPGEHVLNDVGTGFVHIAPSHGIEDFQLGKKFNLNIPLLVESNGVYTKQTPFFAGQHIFKSDQIIIEKLKENRNLLLANGLRHSYPHSWRSKAPLIFRATSQWFISMEIKKLREVALSSIENVSWFPEASKNRILSMVSERPDWCVSRQRSWGVPITIFLNKQTGNPLIDKSVNKRIIAEIEKKGTDAWFSIPSKEFLGPNYNSKNYEKVHDILDVWFDSGSSHVFALKNRGIKDKADLYLEGSDQHRGWFQSSLLQSCAVYGESPYKSVLTHGFVLDEKGKKMSKSLGNIISPNDVIKKYGADILRLWVATSNYNEDLKISYESLERQAETYRKIRNCIRFLLGNLHSWDFSEVVIHEDLPPLEKLIRNEIFRIDKLMSQSFKNFDFYKVFHMISNFCNNELSSLFFDVKKDTLYCDSKNSTKRNSVRTVMFDVYTFLIKWLSPVLVFTAEESWQCWKNEIDLKAEESCHLKKFKDAPSKWENKKIVSDWEKIFDIKKAVSSKIEKLRDEKFLKTSLEAKVILCFKNDLIKDIVKNVDLCEILIVSKIEIISSEHKNLIGLDEYDDFLLKIEKFNGVKCERCWKIFDKKEINNELLCERCEIAINSKSEKI